MMTTLRLFIHQDGAGVHRDSPYEIWDWSSALVSHTAVHDKKFMYCLIPHEAMAHPLVRAKVHSIMAQFLAWDLSIVESGRAPTHGFY
eukprot:14081213-Alexandrium_andersonii.AAC.1